MSGEPTYRCKYSLNTEKEDFTLSKILSFLDLKLLRFVIPLESKWSAWNPNSNAFVILCKSHHYRALEGNFYLLQNKRQSSFFQSVTQVSHILLTYVPTYILKADRRLDFELLF